MRNEERCIRFQYAMSLIGDTYGRDVPTAFANLLADAMHWCKSNEKDFEECLGLARRLYELDTSRKK